MREPMKKQSMKNTIRKTLLRGVCVAALAGIGLAASPRVAEAAFIDFQVNEGVVPGTPINIFMADLLNGGYEANLVLTPTGPGGGTWTETASATFSQYFLDGTALVTPFIGDTEVEGYVILGELQSAGTYVNDTCGGLLCQVFTFTSQTGSLSIDFDQDLAGDIPLLSASGVGPGTGGIILHTGGPTGGTGSFISNFTTNTLAPGIAQLYWPTLAMMSFITTISGDINELALPFVTGDVSVQFSTVQVPEPATLGLLGLGLVVAARVARRRRVAIV
jgi:hypothetical protein